MLGYCDALPCVSQSLGGGESTAKHREELESGEIIQGEWVDEFYFWTHGSVDKHKTKAVHMDEWTFEKFVFP